MTTFFFFPIFGATKRLKTIGMRIGVRRTGREEMESGLVSRFASLRSARIVVVIAAAVAAVMSLQDRDVPFFRDVHVQNLAKLGEVAAQNLGGPVKNTRDGEGGRGREERNEGGIRERGRGRTREGAGRRREDRKQIVSISSKGAASSKRFGAKH